MSNNSESEQIERDNFETDYYGVCSNIEEILDKFKDVFQNVRITNNPNTNQTPPPQLTQLQLPVLDIQTFTGDYNKWIEFRDCFQAVVGKSATLSGVQKLCHLRKSLSPEVLKNIESLPLTDANYEVAWQILVKRYEKGKRIVETHVRKIISSPFLTRESSRDLRNLYNTINNNLQALRNLGQPVDSWDAVLVPIITDKLDQKSKREYEAYYIQEMEKNPSDNSSPTLKGLLKLINNRCELLESLEKEKQDPIKSINKTPRNENKYNAFSSHVNANAISCYFCKRGHTICKCPEFLKLSVSNRIQEIKKLNYCLNCLRPHDNSQMQCSSTKCKLCGRFHNFLLHLEKSSKSSNAAPQVKEENRQPSASRTREDTCETVLSVTSDTESADRAPVLATTSGCEERGVSLFVHSQVLLNTAIVFVEDSNGKRRECRVLLDNGSMTYFVREDFVIL